MKRNTIAFLIFIICLVVGVVLISTRNNQTKSTGRLELPAAPISKPLPTPVVSSSPTQPEPSPTPEPVPPVTELCERLHWFRMVQVDKETLPELTKPERRDYERRRRALIGALEYHIRQNPYGQSLGCDGYYFHSDEGPADYLSRYLDVIPRGLVIRLEKPEITDILRVLRASG